MDGTPLLIEESSLGIWNMLGGCRWVELDWTDYCLCSVQSINTGQGIIVLMLLDNFLVKQTEMVSE